MFRLFNRIYVTKNSASGRETDEYISCCRLRKEIIFFAALSPLTEGGGRLILRAGPPRLNGCFINPNRPDLTGVS